MSKILIINADDLGLTLSRNQAILEGYNKGVISSASAIVNGEYFNDAIEIIGKCPNLGVGIHLNIVEGKALINNRLLCDRNGVFNNGFLAIMLKSRNKAFLEAVENEFRAQIELGTRYIS
ncbi:MAG: ChbG/HpnK family deacetylase, partial [Helicobacteraceae bacterium]|nr:ChbG/HpnK family deacetylase [Helicobacteraceae bacterium]